MRDCICPTCGAQHFPTESPASSDMRFCGLTAAQILSLKREVESYRGGRRAELLGLYKLYIEHGIGHAVALAQARETQKALNDDPRPS